MGDQRRRLEGSRSPQQGKLPPRYAIKIGNLQKLRKFTVILPKISRVHGPQDFQFVADPLRRFS